MYIPPFNNIENESDLYEFVRRWNFGLLASAHSKNEQAQPLIQTTLLPFTIDEKKRELRGHFARANSHWQYIDPVLPVVVTFQGPHCYVSPSWYTSADLVPTWNYAVVQATGTLKIIDYITQCEALINELVAAHEERNDTPWTADRVDDKKRQAMMKAIVCFSISIEELHGKAKISQNRTQADQQGVIDALSDSKYADDRAIAKMMIAGKAIT